MTAQRIGVIGGGIAGLGAAWLLAPHHRVTLLERNDYLGGHANTVEVDGPDGPFRVDTGFMVFNRRNYPQLCALFDHLGVGAYPTSMSFSASLDGGAIEYAGTSLNSLFAQRRNLVNPRFLRMAGDILRFNRAAKRYLRRGETGSLTLGEFLRAQGFGAALADDYLLPMAAAIWSCSTQTMLDFPFATFARFFNNHGLLDLSGRPQWLTVTGGSRSYVERMRASFVGEYRTGCGVQRLWRRGDQVSVLTEQGERLDFDQVVLACHADEALALMADASTKETALLAAFGYQANSVYLHTDPSLMPRERRVWSSWNYLRHHGGPRGTSVSVTYWMNSLQDLPTSKNIFVSLNPPAPPAEQTVLRRLEYRHPMFDGAAIEAQRALQDVQGEDRLWFCGSYHGYGFHEDGLSSAIAVARGLGVEAPWSREPSPESTPLIPAGLPLPQPAKT